MVITLSGVTGVGKSYLKKEINRELGINIQTIVTTRKLRNGELEGVDKKIVSDEEFEKLKSDKEIMVTFEYLGNKYGYPTNQMQSEEISVVELHYSIIYKLKSEVENCLSIYLIPKDIEIAKQKLKERNLPKDVEEKRLKEIDEHIKNFTSNKNLREQFDCIIYNDYTEETVKKITEVIKNRCKDNLNVKVTI